MRNSTYTLTVAVTAHSEGILAGPTMHSITKAIEYAEDAGLQIEKVIGLDNPTDETEAFFQQERFSNWTRHFFNFGDPFLSRNALAQKSHGRFLAFIDGDDLVSENWLSNATLRLIREEQFGRRLIVHPELNWIFDGVNSVFSKVSQQEIYFSPHYFYFGNYYDMMSVYPLDVVLDIPYDLRDLQKGYGYQDWQWNLQTISKGWTHVIEKDTVVYKRRRQNSISEVNRKRNTVCRFVDCMAIDNVRKMRLFGDPTDE